MARSTARAAVMQLIYENLLGGDGGDESLEMIYENLAKEGETKPSGDDSRYISKVLRGVLDQIDTIDEKITAFSVDWTIDRMAKVDLTILRLGIFELMFCEDVPQSVAINEAVELANTFSDPAGSRFINGVLGSVERSIRKES